MSSISIRGQPRSTSHALPPTSTHPTNKRPFDSSDNQSPPTTAATAHSSASAKRQKTIAPSNTRSDLLVDVPTRIGKPPHLSTTTRPPTATTITTTTMPHTSEPPTISSLPSDFFDLTPSIITPTTTTTTNPPPEIDESEWAAFQADVSTPSYTGLLPSATISAAPLSASELLAASTTNNIGQAQVPHQDTDEDTEDARQKLVEELEEMSSLEQRVLRLKQKREALRIPASNLMETEEERSQRRALPSGIDKASQSLRHTSIGSSSLMGGAMGQGDGGDGDDDEEEDDDDWIHFSRKER